MQGKQISANLQATITDGGDLLLSKKKSRRFPKPGQNTHYFYNVTVKQNILRKIKDTHKRVNTICMQMLDGVLSSPQIVPLVEDWVVYLTIFNNTLYHGLHLYDTQQSRVIPGHGINLTVAEMTKLNDILEETHESVPYQQLVISTPQFTWQWHDQGGQIRDNNLWWSSELNCLQSALHSQPGNGCKLHIKSRLDQQNFNSDFLDNILLKLTAKRIKYLANPSPYMFNSQDNELSSAKIDIHGIEALESITKVELFEEALRLINKNQYISMDNTAFMIETIASYQKNPQIIANLKIMEQTSADSFLEI